MRLCTECFKDMSELKSAHKKCWHCRTGNKPKRGPRYTYTKEAIATAVKTSNNVTDVMRLLNIRLAGGSHSHISKKIKEYNIDTSHFLGSASTKGLPAKSRKTWQQILYLGQPTDARTRTILLKRALLEHGLTYECSQCKISEWKGKKLTLHIDHISGIIYDNRPENVRFLCPNCHSQTDTYCRPKGG